MSWERAVRHAVLYRRAISNVPLIVLGHKTAHGWQYTVWVRTHLTTQEQRNIPPRERR